MRYIFISSPQAPIIAFAAMQWGTEIKYPTTCSLHPTTETIQFVMDKKTHIIAGNGRAFIIGEHTTFEISSNELKLLTRSIHCCDIASQVNPKQQHNETNSSLQLQLQ